MIFELYESLIVSSESRNSNSSFGCYFIIKFMLRLFKGFKFCTTPLNSVAVFNSKKYDIEFFNLINDAAAEDKKLSIHFFSEEVSERTLKLATDCKTIWYISLK